MWVFFLSIEDHVNGIWSEEVGAACTVQLNVGERRIAMETRYSKRGSPAAWEDL